MKTTLSPRRVKRKILCLKKLIPVKRPKTSYPQNKYQKFKKVINKVKKEKKNVNAEIDALNFLKEKIQRL